MPALKQANHSPAEKFIDSIDPNDPEYLKALMRPAEIKEDVKLMEQRSRVTLILKSPSFRKELEDIVQSQLRNYPNDLSALLQFSDLILPQTKLGSSLFNTEASTPVIPINDLRSGDTGMNRKERLLRCKVASLFRLCDLFKYNSGFDNLITVRISRDDEQYLVNPYGFLYREITAFSLIKINKHGDVVEQGSTNLAVNRESWSLHAAAHSARDDIRVVMHVTDPACVTVSGMPSGFLLISQEAMTVGHAPVFDPASIEPDYVPVSAEDGESDLPVEIDWSGYEAKQRNALAELLSDGANVVMIKHNGALICTQSVEQAWSLMSLLMHACQVQHSLSPLGLDQLVFPSEDSTQQAFRVGRLGAEGVNFGKEDVGGIKWSEGEFEFESLMRKLDAAGHQTGYMYRQPAVKQDRRKHPLGTDVEIPPYTSNLTMARQQSGGDSVDGERPLMPTKSDTLNRWLNTPNAYVKEEIDEVGTAIPRKITRWISIDSQDVNKNTSGQGLLIDNPYQFAKQGQNPKELKENLQKVKSKYYQDTITAGPPSKILDNAPPPQDEADGKPPGEKVQIVGAASKGIIQREHRNDPTVFQNVYAPNPFDKVTDKDIEEYKHDVRLKSDPDYAAQIAFAKEAEEREQRKQEEEEMAAAKKREAELLAASRAKAAEAETIQPERFSERAQEPQPSTSLSVPKRSETMKSDTSGADPTSEKEGKSDSKDKKKKRKFKIPSFSRKKK